MRQLQSFSMVDIGLCDVLGDAQSRALLGALEELPRTGELTASSTFEDGALLVPWIQRAGLKLSHDSARVMSGRRVGSPKWDTMRAGRPLYVSHSRWRPPMHGTVNRRRIVSVGCVLEGLLIGVVACGTPPVGSGGSGSGSTGDGDSDSAGDDEPGDDPEADDGSETRGSGGRGTGYPGAVGEDGGDDDGGSSESGEPSDPPTAPPPDSDCECAPPTVFSHAWIANPQDDTVSKLDTGSMQIVGRFATRAPAMIPAGGSTSTAAEGAAVTGPVATSVSIDGRAAVVANQSGGLTKIYAHPQDCDATQNTAAGLQTSTDGTALAWGWDECVAWHVAFDFTTQTTVAWGPGDFDPITCDHVDQVVWTAGCNEDEDLLSSVVRIDGDSGMVLDEIGLSAFPCASALPTMGAVDREGSFWFAANDPETPRLGRISAQGQLLVIEVPPVVPSGIAIDPEGRVWLSSRGASGLATAARYMPATNDWDLAQNILATGRSGIVADEAGRMWLAYQGFAGAPVPGGTFVEGDTMQVDAPVGAVCPSGGCGTISLDFTGRVWTTSVSGDRVHRYDPQDGSVSMSSGMNVSAHGSDMTGWALHNAVCNG